MLRACPIPGLFITGTDTGVGKTVIAAAIARSISNRGLKVGVCKIAATGCVDRGGRLVSEDAEMLSLAAGGRFPIETICPIRYVEPLAPAVAAQRCGIPLDWSLLQQSLDTLSSQSDFLIVEGVGGILVPMDDHHTVLDVAKWLGLPAVIVARPGLGTFNHTLLTSSALQSAGVVIAGVVINRFPVSPDVAEQTNPSAIEKWGRLPVLGIVPEINVSPPRVPDELVRALDGIAWTSLGCRATLK